MTDATRYVYVHVLMHESATKSCFCITLCNIIISRVLPVMVKLGMFGTFVVCTKVTVYEFLVFIMCTPNILFTLII